MTNLPVPNARLGTASRMMLDIDNVSHLLNARLPTQRSLISAKSAQTHTTLILIEFVRKVQVFQVVTLIHGQQLMDCSVQHVISSIIYLLTKRPVVNKLTTNTATTS